MHGGGNMKQTSNRPHRGTGAGSGAEDRHAGEVVWSDPQGDIAPRLPGRVLAYGPSGSMPFAPGPFIHPVVACERPPPAASRLRRWPLSGSSHSGHERAAGLTAESGARPAMATARLPGGGTPHPWALTPQRPTDRPALSVPRRTAGLASPRCPVAASPAAALGTLSSGEGGKRGACRGPSARAAAQCTPWLDPPRASFSPKSLVQTLARPLVSTCTRRFFCAKTC